MGKNTQSMSDLKADTSSIQQEIQVLRQKLKHQNRLLKSIWGIVREKIDVDDETLEVMMRLVTADEEDAPDIAEACPHCTRPLQDNSPICIYCGTKHDHQHLF